MSCFSYFLISYQQVIKLIQRIIIITQNIVKPSLKYTKKKMNKLKINNMQPNQQNINEQYHKNLQGFASQKKPKIVPNHSRVSSFALNKNKNILLSYPKKQANYKQSSRQINQQKIQEIVNKQFECLKMRIQNIVQNFNQNIQRPNKASQIHINFNSVKINSKEHLLEHNDILKMISKKINQFIKKKPIQVQENKAPKYDAGCLNKSGDSFQNWQMMDPSLKIKDFQIKNPLQNKQMHSKRFSSTQQYNQSAVSKGRSPQKQNALQQNLMKTSVNFSCSSTVSQILFKQAKNKSFTQFHNLCQKIMLQRKPIVTDFHFFKKQKIQTTNSYLNQIHKKLSLINTQLAYITTDNLSGMRSPKNGDQSRNIGEQIDEICVILKKLNQIHNLNSLIFNCNRPCCRYQQKHEVFSSKAKILMNLKQSAKKNIHYKTDQSDKYFNFYYKKDSFDKTRIYSLSKTKTQQMQQISKAYTRNKQNKKRCKTIKKRAQSFCATFQN